MERYKRWRARFWANGKAHWLTVDSIDGTKASALKAAKAKAPSFWTNPNVRPVWSTVIKENV